MKKWELRDQNHRLNSEGSGVRKGASVYERYGSDLIKENLVRAPPHTFESQRAVLGLNPHLPPCLRQGLTFAYVQTRLAAPCLLVFLVSTAHLVLGALESEM